MSDPVFTADRPMANQSSSVWNMDNSGLAEDVICQVRGIVNPGSNYTLQGIWVANTTAQLSGTTQAEQEQEIRDAQHEVASIVGTNWNDDGSLGAYRGQTNYFHAVADFTPNNQEDPPISIAALNVPWTPNLVTACPT